MSALAPTRPRTVADPAEGVATLSAIEQLQTRHDFTKWLYALGFALVIVSAVICRSLEDMFIGLMIAAACAIPFYVWGTRAILGLPILPVVSLMYFLFYGLPFITGHPFTEEFSSEQKWFAGGTVCAVIVIATFIWYQLGKPRSPRPRRILLIDEAKAARFLLLGLGAGCLFQLQALFGFVNLSSEVFGIARAILQSLALMAIFGLSYQIAAGHLTRGQGLLFLAGLAIYILESIASLYLIGGMEITALATLGYFLGGGRAPVKMLAAVLVLFAVLNAGKGTIRDRYWDEYNNAVASDQIFEMFGEWFQEGLRNVFGNVDPSARNVSLAERASLTQMVLITESSSPNPVPYLFGSSYTLIPQLMIPRILWPERPTTQEALRQLSERYGLLTVEGLESTSIGWGLIAEAYANFGSVGCLLLGILLGAMVGLVQRHCGRAPALSARSLFALLSTMVMLRVETNAALLVTALFQSMVVLVLMMVIVMHRAPARI